MLANGEQRTYREDSDTLILRGWSKRPSPVHIGLGEVRGTVLSRLLERPLSDTPKPLEWCQTAQSNGGKWPTN